MMTEASPGVKDDEELVGAARHGDRDAFATLFDRHRPVATALVSRLLGDVDDVADVIQETAIQALVGLPGLREPSRFGPWLCGIALNLARRQLRYRLRWAPLLAEPGGLQPAPDELLEDAETAAAVRRAVAGLPAGQREAVRLFYLASLREAEVAAELGIAKSAVKSRLFKARRSLTTMLRPHQEVPMVQPSLIDVDLVDVRREPSGAPGASRTHVALIRDRVNGRVLPIFVGEFEGRAMASNLTGMQTPRPMTYQLAASLIAALSGSVTEVRVVRLAQTTYIAEVVLNHALVIDARPSDAINLALLTDAPIRVASDVLDQWATGVEPIDPNEYSEGAGDIRQELDSLLIEPESPRRLSPAALDVLSDARLAATSRGHTAVSTEHLLVALLQHSTPERIAALGIGVAEVEDAVDRISPSPRTGGGPASLNPRLTHLLWRAGERARSRPDPRAEPDDILAALLDEPRGHAANILDRASVDRDAVRANLSNPPQ